VKVGLKQYIKLIDILKKGAFGTTNRSVAIDSYSSYLQSNSISYNLVPDEDIVLQDTRDYYFTNPCTGFVPFTKKNVIQLFPLKQDEIKAYLKTKKVNFSSREDLLKLADYLRAL
jgi:hypothetical protein